MPTGLPLGKEKISPQVCGDGTMSISSAPLTENKVQYQNLHLLVTEGAK